MGRQLASTANVWARSNNQYGQEEKKRKCSKPWRETPSCTRNWGCRNSVFSSPQRHIRERKHACNNSTYTRWIGGWGNSRGHKSPTVSSFYGNFGRCCRAPFNMWSNALRKMSTKVVTILVFCGEVSFSFFYMSVCRIAIFLFARNGVCGEIVVSNPFLKKICYPGHWPRMTVDWFFHEPSELTGDSLLTGKIQSFSDNRLHEAIYFWKFQLVVTRSREWWTELVGGCFTSCTGYYETRTKDVLTEKNARGSP